MANQTRDFPSETDLNLIKLKTQLYAKVDEALDEAINKINEYKGLQHNHSIIQPPTEEQPKKTVEQILGNPKPLTTPFVGKKTEGEEDFKSPDPSQKSHYDPMNIDEVATEEVDKAYNALLQSAAFEKRMAQYDCELYGKKKEKPSQLQIASTELANAILNYTNAVKEDLIKSLTTELTRYRYSAPNPGLPSVQKKERKDNARMKLLEKLALGSLSKDEDFTTPLAKEHLKEDDSKLIRATKQEIRSFNAKNDAMDKLKEQAQKKLMEAKAMVDTIDELFPEPDPYNS